MKICSIALALIILTAQAKANSDTLLSKMTVNLARPFILINIKSTDCSSCRINAFNVLKGIKIDPAKIVLLSDDRQMATYFDEYSDLYSKYLKIYSKPLSKSFAVNDNSSVCLILKDTSECYKLSGIDSEKVQYFRTKILKPSNLNKAVRYLIKDSLLSDFSNLAFTDSIVNIFSSGYQNTFTYNIRNKSWFRNKIKYGIQTIDSLSAISNQHTKKIVFPSVSSMKALRVFGLPNILVTAQNLENKSAMAYFHLVTIDSIFINPQTSRLDSNIGIRKNGFLVENCISPQTDILFTNESRFISLDTLVYKGKILTPVYYSGYQYFNNHYYFGFFECSATLELVNPLRYYYVAELSISDRNKPIIINVFKFDYKDSTEIGNSVFKIDDKGYPVVVNNKQKTIDISQYSLRHSFDYFKTGDGGNLGEVYDFKLENENLIIVAKTTKNHFIEAVYNLKTKKAHISRLETDIVYKNMLLKDNVVIGIGKFDETATVVLDIFSNIL